MFVGYRLNLKIVRNQCSRAVTVCTVSLSERITTCRDESDKFIRHNKSKLGEFDRLLWLVSLPSDCEAWENKIVKRDFQEKIEIIGGSPAIRKLQNRSQTFTWQKGP